MLLRLQHNHASDRMMDGDRTLYTPHPNTPHHHSLLRMMFVGWEEEEMGKWDDGIGIMGVEEVDDDDPTTDGGRVDDYDPTTAGGP